MSLRSHVRFFVNGREFKLDNPDPEQTLVSFLRDKLNLTGTKVACSEGACGACTVVLSRWNSQHQKAVYRAANACLTPVFLVDGCAVQTVEGIGTAKRMHAIQQRLSRGHGTQCGFCSPGFVMSLYALLRNHPQPTTDQIDEAIRGNLCRCTGYRPILESFYSLSSNGCCQQGKGECACLKALKTAVDGGDTQQITSLTFFDDFPSYDPTQEPIFPPQLIIDARHVEDSALVLKGRRVDVTAPTSIGHLTKIYEQNGINTKLISTGLITRFVNTFNKSNDRIHWLSLHAIDELKTYAVGAKEIRIGSGLSLTDFVDVLKANNKDGLFDSIQQLFAKYSSTQVRNIASWSGALCSASSSSEFCTLALACGYSVEVLGLQANTKRILPIDQAFFAGTSGSKTLLHRDDLILNIIIPTPLQNERIVTFKIGERHGADTTELNAVGRFSVEQDVIGNAVIAIGGVDRKPWIAQATARSLVGKRLSLNSNIEPVLAGAIATLDSELNKITGNQQPAVKIEHRKALARAALFQFVSLLSNPDSSEVMPIARRSPLHAHQIFNEVASSQPDSDAVGRPLSHQSSDVHTTGEAKYTADVKVADMLHMALVLSTEAHAEIVSIDASPALAITGVVDYVDIQDIPAGGTNTPGADQKMFMMPEDSPVFADGKVEAIGQPIGAIVADDVETARRAAKLVKIEYKRLKPIITMQEAIEAQSFHIGPSKFQREWCDEKDMFQQCAFIAEGDVTLGAQEHAYMETQSAVCVPGENDEWLIYSSTQMTSFAQLHSASVLGIPKNKIVLKTKRVGGAFGGKASAQCGYARSPALIAANKLKRPVKCCLSRRDDLLVTGTRHPMEAHYKIGCDEAGQIVAADFEAYINGGYTIEHSYLVAMVLAMSADHCYRVPHMRAICYPCKTNIASNTAFRGFGMPQANFIMEAAISHLSHDANINRMKFVEQNFALKGWKRLCEEEIQADSLVNCWQRCKTISRLEELQKEVCDFNSSHTFLKRGMSMCPARQGFPNGGSTEQSFALVQIYMDGSVSVSIGGVEMGQGLFTKCVQVASRALGVPVSRISILDASTDKTANSPATGGSQGSDVHGLSIKAACEILAERLAPIKKEFPEGNFESWVWKAYERQIGLSAGAHRTILRGEVGLPEVGSTYFTTGAANTVVEINALTGEHRLISVDIVMDCGDTLSPAIDVGQIEGAFIQGYGLFAMEEYDYTQDGHLITDSLGKYKVPTADVIPERFRVMILDKSDTHAGMVYSSKAIGEPPLLLGLCPVLAIREAINAYLESTDRHPTFLAVNSPLTAVRIRQACAATLPGMMHK